MKGFRMVALVLTLLVAVVGCGGGKSADNGKGAASDPGAKAETPKAETKAAANLEPVRIGAIVGLTGRLEALGTHDRIAMEIVAEEINKNGGIAGHPLELKFYDEMLAPAESLAQAANDGIFAFVGTDSSDNTLKYYPEIMKMKKIFMVTGAGSPAITDAVTKDPATNKYLFRNGAHARDWARTAAVYLRDIAKAKTYFYISQDAAFGKSLEGVLAEMVKGDGITSVGAHYSKREETDFTEVFKKIEAAKPDVIISYLGVSGFPFAEQYSAKQFPVPFFDIAANFLELEDKVQKDLGTKSNHMALTLFSANVPTTSKTQPFWAEYVKRSGEKPGGLFDVRAADSLYILAEAITQAGGPDTDKVVSVLERKEFTGISGIYGFDSSHQAKWGPRYLSGLIGQWQDGKLQIIWPSETQTAQYTPAPWWSTRAAAN